VGPKVVPDGGDVVLRRRVTAGLTVDHRVADGADAARLLADLQRILDDL
jgi:pyruvate dehydrogenase E2 component (dihydrolipoamide acetyltransferase)